jgi:predicted AlkP superfamily phosphohydrolase/phosphomutase
MSTPPAKILVLAIDAANPALLQEWAKDGTLPNLHLLMSRGLVGNTRSIDGFYVGATWPTFYTGVTPARHGFHYLVQLKPGTYDFYRPADEGIVKSEPFWRHLSRAGRRVAILDVPLSPIDPAVNGMQIVEWGSHDAVYGFHAMPSTVADTVLARFGAHPANSSCDGVRRSAAEYQAFIDDLIRGVRAKTNLTKHFLAQGDWDFFMQVFTESHCVGHQCWHLHDAHHPAYDASIAGAIGDPLRTVYREIDAAIGDVIAHAGNALILVLVAHGMSYWYGANFLLRDILFRLGVAQPLTSNANRPNVPSILFDSTRSIWRRLPASIRGQLAPVRGWLDRASSRGDSLPTLEADPSSSYCFPHNNGLAISGIRLNLVGREPQGILRPGAAADAFCDQLTTDLLAVVDERTGNPLVQRVTRTAKLYDGENLNHLPDLLVEWNDEVPTGSTIVSDGVSAKVRAKSPKIGIVEGVNEYGRTGEHRPNGLFMAIGPNLQPNRLDRDVSILDFAPTFTKALALDLSRFDGHPIPELIESVLFSGER